MSDNDVLYKCLTSIPSLDLYKLFGSIVNSSGVSSDDNRTYRFYTAFKSNQWYFLTYIFLTLRATKHYAVSFAEVDKKIHTLQF